jgi:hypothetical protein
MSMRKPAQLTDTQLVILAAATQRDDNLVILPATLKGSAAQKVVTKLTASGLLKEVRVKSDQPAWRTDETGHHVGLKITKAGESAIGIDDGSPDQPPSSNENAEGEPHVPEGKNTAATQEPTPRLKAGRHRLTHATGRWRNARSPDQGNRLAAAHHARGAHGGSKEGLHDREIEGRRRQDRLRLPLDPTFEARTTTSWRRQAEGCVRCAADQLMRHRLKLRSRACAISTLPPFAWSGASRRVPSYPHS